MLSAFLSSQSGLQFALFTSFNWLFIPLTIGLAFIIAIMESYYVMTENDFWERTTKFWVKIFAVNFVASIVAGIILELRFGTFWRSNSWFIGNFFATPQSVAAVLVIVLVITFFIIMFFGWNRVGKRVHLFCTWMVSLFTIISAFRIIIINAWMQYPVGMEFNPSSARNEITQLISIALSPVSINKFLHTVTDSFVLGGIAVIGISCWYLLKKREEEFSRKSIRIASVVAFISLLALIWTGNRSAYQIARKQPMKLAAMEGLYRGSHGAPLTLIGILNPHKSISRLQRDSLGFVLEKPFLFNISVPNGLSLLINKKANSFVPGIEDIMEGGYPVCNGDEEMLALSVNERIAKGKTAVKALALYNRSLKSGDSDSLNIALKELQENYVHFGYGFIETPAGVVPPIGITFYSFRVMIILGIFFLIYLPLVIYYERRRIIGRTKWLLRLGIVSVPLVYICSQAGWIVAEAGRQPWMIQDMLTPNASLIDVGSSGVLSLPLPWVILFAALFTAQLFVIFKIIGKGPSLREINTLFLDKS